MESSSAISGALRSLHHLDKDITLAINSCNSPLSDSVWQVITDHRTWIVLYIGIAVLMVMRLGWKKGLVAILACILCVVACDQLANVIKEAVQRLRPVFDQEMIARGLHVLEVPGKPYGFYSAHAANTAGFVVCSWMGLRQDKSRSYNAYLVLMSTWAFVVGMSRVFVGKHFLGDVLAGFAVGIAIGFLCSFVASLAVRKLKI